MKVDQIEQIIQKSVNQTNPNTQFQSSVEHENNHLFRAIFIAIDCTQSMQIKDLKPSRLGVTIKVLQKYIKMAQDSTPICRFLVARVQNQLCKPLTEFVYKREYLEEVLNQMRINQKSGFFSLENTLTVAMDYFQSVPSYFHKELLIIQSSAFTKDYRDIYGTISTFQKSQIAINIASLVGWTFVFQKLTQSCHGDYITIGSQQQLQEFMGQKSKPPKYDSRKVIKKLVKMSLAKREYSQQKIKCFCHFKSTHSFFVCGVCKAVLCTTMPFECPVCMCILVFPSDLYRHGNK